MTNRSTRLRLNKLIAQSSEMSRRAADEAIARGEVTVNDTVVTTLGVTVDPRVDRIRLRGKLLSPPQEHIYLMFHKPRGCLVTKADPQGRPTIWTMLKAYKERTNAVGRLDLDSEGLLIVTSDGGLSYRLTHPRHGIWKRYQVKVRGKPSEESLDRLRRGIVLKEGRTAPAHVRSLKEERDGTWIEVFIQEGWNRQIRRMCNAIGHRVIRLRRTSIGALSLGRLKAGDCRKLAPSDVHKLVEACEI